MEDCIAEAHTIRQEIYNLAYDQDKAITGKMGIKYGAVFMPYLPQRRDKHGKPCGLTQRRPYTVLRLFLTDLEDGIHLDICSVLSINVFFPVLCRGRHPTLG